MTLLCFKAYDIRGRVPEELDAALAERIGAGTASLLGPGPVVLGRDIRLSSPELQAALEKGFTASGRDVIDIGLCGTEEVYFQTFHRQAAGGVMVTASHNPMGYNGMKLVREHARPISGDTGLFDVRDFAAGDTPLPSGTGQVRTDADKTAYIQHLLGYVDVNQLKPLKIVVNAGNGGAGIVIDELAPHLPFEFVRIQHEPDGSFPNGIPNPLLPENRAATADAVRAHGADFGIAWDGDFDRCFFFDENGRFIPGEYIVGLLGAAFLEKSPGEKIVHDPRVIMNTRAMIEEAGGEAVVSKTGHAFIKRKMRDVSAIYGGEMSAHHYFRDFYYCDSGMIPWLLMIELLSRKGMTLAEMLEERMRLYPSSGETNYTISDPDAAIARLIETYEPQADSRDDLDGVSLNFGKWRFNLRKSNTEPVVRLNVESDGDAALVREKQTELAALLKA